MNLKVPYILKFVIFNILFILIASAILLYGSRLSNSSEFLQYKSTARENNRIYIVIDAGHGGEDGGAQSADGLSEKTLNLDIAKKLYELFKLSDFTPVMVRDDDRLMYKLGEEKRKKYYDIKNRIDFANDYPDSVFISIHQNKFPIEKYSGFQVYYSKNNEYSKIYADIVQDNVKSLLQKENKRMSKQADRKIKLLDNLYMPAILAECGFLSNTSEARLLSNDTYRSKIAYLLYISTIQFLEKWEYYEK